MKTAGGLSAQPVAFFHLKDSAATAAKARSMP
jgi:hypothetical protein